MPGERASSPSVAPVSALTGFRAALPTSFSQIWLRSCASMGAFRPPARNAAEIATQRSLREPSGSQIANRVPST